MRMLHQVLAIAVLAAAGLGTGAARATDSAGDTRPPPTVTTTRIDPNAAPREPATRTEPDTPTKARTYTIVPKVETGIPILVDTTPTSGGRN